MSANATIIIDTVYDYYDGPLTYTTFDLATRERRLVFWAGHCRWLETVVSDKRLTDLEAGRMPQRDALLKSESGFITEVTIDKNGVESLREIPCSEISEDDLTEPEVMLMNPNLIDWVPCEKCGTENRCAPMDHVCPVASEGTE